MLAGIALCWLLITPPGAAPDEPSHLTRAGAIVHGDLDGEFLPDLLLTSYEVPDEYLLPDPACYAIAHPTTPVSCAEPAPRPGGSLTLASRADEYPLWGHLTYGAASLLPGPDPIWWARAGGAAIALALIGFAGAARGTAWGWTGVIVALTPMAWFTIATVNPSSFGIAGAIALWTTLMLPRDQAPSAGIAWLTAAGWAALALPRRDGLIWACTVLAIAILATDLDVRSWWRRLGLGPQLVIAASTLATIVWGARQMGRVTQAVVASPLIVVGAAVARVTWVRWGTSPARRAAMIAGALCLATIGTVVLVLSRPGGWDGRLARDVIDQTGANLEEAIGVLGWLDVVLPFIAIVLAVGGLAVLATPAIVEQRRLIAIAVAIVGVAVLTSWVFELYQGNTSARYWQGRYSLPLLVGIPLVLTSAPAHRPAATRVGLAAAGAMLLTLNIAIWAGARRWGVGIDGPLAPWRWDTVHQPVEPFVVLVVHAMLTAGVLALLADRSGAPSAPDPADSRTPPDTL